jgi:uncharacterized protein YjbJ (UPF0337 family)
MDREHVKGGRDKAKGAIKNTAGKVAGGQTEVKFDKAQGSAHNDVVDMRDVAQRSSEKSR